MISCLDTVLTFIYCGWLSVSLFNRVAIEENVLVYFFNNVHNSIFLLFSFLDSYYLQVGLTDPTKLLPFFLIFYLCVLLTGRLLHFYLVHILLIFNFFCSLTFNIQEFCYLFSECPFVNKTHFCCFSHEILFSLTFFLFHAFSVLFETHSLCFNVFYTTDLKCLLILFC